MHYLNKAPRIAQDLYMLKLQVGLRLLTALMKHLKETEVLFPGLQVDGVNSMSNASKCMMHRLTFENARAL